MQDRGAQCWGNDARGVLEGLQPEKTATPANVSSLDVGFASYAITDDGAAWSWGAGDQGVLGDGSMVAKPAPARIAGLHDVRQVATGGLHACALTRPGDVLCWGDNNCGQIGTGSPKLLARPTPVHGAHGAMAISAGSNRSCALTHDGHVICWGMLGYDTPGERREKAARSPDMAWPHMDQGPSIWNPIPSVVPGVSGALELSSGSDVDCIRDTEGVQCWSVGFHGPGPDALPPTRLPIASVTHIVAGPGLACALDVAGAVTCFPIASGHLGAGQSVYF